MGHELRKQGTSPGYEIADLLSPRAGEALTALIAEIYDAALDSARWPDVLASISEFVGARVGTSPAIGPASTMGSVMGDDGSGLSHEMRARMALVRPHLRRAIVIAKGIDAKRTEAATLAETLDGLNAGLFLVDADGTIIHANAAARRILVADDVLRAVGGRVVARDANANHRLRQLLAAAGAGQGGAGAIALPSAGHDARRHVAHVVPVTGTQPGADRDAVAMAALFVCKAGLSPPSLPDLIADVYRLTPAELRVLLAIVDIGGVPEVAAALGVAVTTIKTHLGRLYEKTGAARQADLVKLVAGFSSPLLD